MRTPARIFIADDNPDNLDIFRSRLAVHGYEALTATDGEEALSLARKQQPDLILLDVMMPEAKGGQILTNRKTLSDVEQLVDVEPIGELPLKGFARPVPAFSILALRL